MADFIFIVKLRSIQLSFKIMDHEWLFSTVIRFCALQPDVKKIQEKYLLNPFTGVPKASDFILWVDFPRDTVKH